MESIHRQHWGLPPLSRRGRPDCLPAFTVAAPLAPAPVAGVGEGMGLFERDSSDTQLRDDSCATANAGRRLNYQQHEAAADAPGLCGRSFLCSNPLFCLCVMVEIQMEAKEGEHHIRRTARLLPGPIVETLAGHHRGRWCLVLTLNMTRISAGWTLCRTSLFHALIHTGITQHV